MSISLSEQAVRHLGGEHPGDPQQEKSAGVELGVLKDLIGYQMRRAQMRMFHSFANKLEHTKITPAQMGLLMKIKHNEGISQTALAKANGIERSTLGEIIDRFEKRGLVERRRHDSDRRAYALYLSQAGEQLLQEILPLVVAHEQEVFSHWPEADRHTLLTLLTRLGDEATD